MATLLRLARHCIHLFFPKLYLRSWMDRGGGLFKRAKGSAENHFPGISSVIFALYLPFRPFLASLFWRTGQIPVSNKPSKDLPDGSGACTLLPFFFFFVVFLLFTHLPPGETQTDNRSLMWFWRACLCLFFLRIYFFSFHEGIRLLQSQLKKRRKKTAWVNFGGSSLEELVVKLTARGARPSGVYSFLFCLLLSLTSHLNVFSFFFSFCC